MSRLITIKANNGKVFTGTNYIDLENEVNEYEANLKLQQEKAEAERKAKEEKQNELAEYRKVKLKEINDDFSKAVAKIKEYEKETGYKVIYNMDYTNGNTMVTDAKNSIDFAWDNILVDVFKMMYKKQL